MIVHHQARTWTSARPCGVPSSPALSRTPVRCLRRPLAAPPAGFVAPQPNPHPLVRHARTGSMRRARRSSLWPPPPGGSHGRARVPPRFAGRGCLRGPPQRSPALARLAAAAPAAPSGVARPLPGPASSSGPPSAWEGLFVVPERRTEAQGLSSFPNGVLKAALCSPRPLKRPFVLRGRTCRRSRTAYQKRGACRRYRTAS